MSTPAGGSYAKQARRLGPDAKTLLQTLPEPWSGEAVDTTQAYAPSTECSLFRLGVKIVGKTDFVS